MNTTGFSMKPNQIKEFLIHQCKIAEIFGAVNVMRDENGLIFLDKNNEVVLRINW